MIDYNNIAAQFRNAIEKAIDNRDVVIQNLYAFPTGCCGYASDFLQRYLFEEKGVFTWYMSGEYGYGEDIESHTWLETQDHSLVIDITGDQYKYNSNLPFSTAVYVGKRNDGFHNKFQLHEPAIYKKQTQLYGLELKKDQQYKIILKHIERI